MRFNNNLGESDLVEQWNRSVRLSKEAWVWLFSDDDIASPDCVEKFYEILKYTNSEYNVYMFNTCIIDKKGNIVHISPSLPQKEAVSEFIYHRFAGQRHNCATKCIFSRRAFNNNNGFVNYSMAWYSDDASWIKFANDNGFYTIEDAYVKFRANSSKNISSPNPEDRTKKIISIFNYLSQILDKYEIGNVNKIKVNQDSISKMLRSWILINLEYIGGVPLPMLAFVLNKMKLFCGSSRIRDVIALSVINYKIVKRKIYLLKQYAERRLKIIN